MPELAWKRWEIQRFLLCFFFCRAGPSVCNKIDTFSFSTGVWRQTCNYCVPPSLKKGRSVPKWDYTEEFGVDGKHKISKINFHHKIEKESSLPWRMDSKGCSPKAVVKSLLFISVHSTLSTAGTGILWHPVLHSKGLLQPDIHQAKVLHSLAFQKIQQIHSLRVLAPDKLALYCVVSTHTHWASLSF